MFQTEYLWSHAVLINEYCFMLGKCHFISGWLIMYCYIEAKRKNSITCIGYQNVHL